MAIDRMNLLRTMGSLLLALVILDAILILAMNGIKFARFMATGY